MDNTTVEGYEFRAIGVAYDALNRLLWLPFGSGRLRRGLVEALDLGATDSVLELGCGTGLVTEHLVATGASVMAIDGAENMLRRARQRAPEASFRTMLVTDDLPEGPFTAVVLSFVLHELDPQTRAAVLREASQRLGPGGRIGVLEWRSPSQPALRSIWRAVVKLIEPDVAHDMLDDGLERAISDAGMTMTERFPLANGRAEVVLAV